MLIFERSRLRWVLAAAVLAVIVVYSVSAGLLGVGGMSFFVPEKVPTSSNNVLLNPSSWSLLTVPCPWNETWCVNDDPPLHKYRILVDLGHAERVKVDGVTSTNLDKSSNSRIFDWQDWAKDMRAQGYEVNVLTKKPLSAADLINADLFIVAQPDKGKSGPVYFTAEEKEAIACFILRGNTLLVMAQQFMGGKDQTTYNGDMKTTYASADVVNDLLEGIHVDGRFTEGKVSGDVLDLMDSKNAGTQVFSGKLPDIWLPAGNLKPEMKSATFAYFHGLSVEPGTTGWLVRADSTTFTSPKNTKYSPVVQPEGSLPVAIGVNGLGCGKVYLYGDPSAWQKESYIGKVYSETKYHEQEAARVLIARMMSFNRTCEPCDNQASGQTNQVNQPGLTGPATSPRVTVTSLGNCDSCVDNCIKKFPNGGGELIQCIGQGYKDHDACSVSNLQVTDGGLISCKYCQDKFPLSGSGYAQCIKDNACSCPITSGNCDNCINNCKKGATSCIGKCEKQYSGKCDCNTCTTRCGSNGQCYSVCLNTDGNFCDCQGCLQSLHQGDTAGVGSCAKQFPAGECDCNTCLIKCANDLSCLSQCKIDDSGKSCVSLMVGKKSCYDCIDKCKKDDVTCVLNCQSQFPCDCKECQAACGSDPTCITACKDMTTKIPCTFTNEDCGSCLKNCPSGSHQCIDGCENQYRGTCDCQTCITQCGTNTDCLTSCKSADGSDCSSDSQDGAGCVACITTCNNQKDASGNDLSDDALKQCYNSCGSGFCESVWNQCNPVTIIQPGDDTTDTIPNLHNPPVATLSPASCYLKSMTDSQCECSRISTLCRTPCSNGQTPVIQPDGTTRCVSGTLDAAACGNECSSTMSGKIDSCGDCQCTLPNQIDCSTESCPSGQTATAVNGGCTCQGIVVAVSTPLYTTQSGSCLDCYKDCIKQSSTGTKDFQHLYGNAMKTSEIVVNTCQKKCDTQFKTTIASCACANTHCEEGETATPTSDLSCICGTTLTSSGTTIDLAALQNQWNEHHEGTQVSPSTGGTTNPNCHQECMGWCWDNSHYPPSQTCCEGYKTVCP